MSKIWEEYKGIKCGDFLKWWDKKTTSEKTEWESKKDKIDLEKELLNK